MILIYFLQLIVLFVFIPGRISATESIHIEAVVLCPVQVAEVPAQQTGLLQQLLVTEGTKVTAGQVLAKLDSREAELSADKAKLDYQQSEARANNQIRVQYAEKSLEVARAELKRSEESIEKFAKSISQSQLDVERLTVEKLILERKQAAHDLTLEQFESRQKRNELETAELRLQQHQIRAPFTGTVALIRGRMGEWLEVGEPVMRLVAVNSLRAEGFLQAKHASRDLLGKQVQFKVNSKDNSGTAKGTLRFVSPEMDPVTGQVRVWAEVSNKSGQLKPGSQGVLEILLDK